jgi:hypothetical protein
VRENAASKGRRLLVEGRLRIRSAGPAVIVATCIGDSAEVYHVGYEPGGWHCSCPALTRCSHLTALMLVTLRPGGSRDV